MVDPYEDLILEDGAFIRTFAEELNEEEQKRKKAGHMISMKPDEIDQLILAGGSSNLIFVKDLLRKYFGGKEPINGIPVKETIAFGAAYRAADIVGVVKEEINLLNDILHHRFGIELCDIAVDDPKDIEIKNEWITEKNDSAIAIYTMCIYTHFEE